MKKREKLVNDPAIIRDILDKCKYLHLALVDDGKPYVVAMNYGYTFEDGKLVIYMHTGLNAEKLAVIAKNPACSFMMECEVEPFKGKVACQYGMSYYCLNGNGTIQVLEDLQDKIDAMTNLMKTQTGRDFEFNERLVSIVTLMRIDITDYTAMHRPAPAVKFD